MMGKEIYYQWVFLELLLFFIFKIKNVIKFIFNDLIVTSLLGPLLT